MLGRPARGGSRGGWSWPVPRSHCASYSYRHISEFLEWKDLRLTRESYKVSPVSILASMVDSGDCRDEVFDFLPTYVNDDVNRKLLSLVNNKEGQ